MIWILRTLFSHYRIHPAQGVFLLAGVVMANALLVGTQLINAQARASYAQGEQVLQVGPVAQVTHRNAGSMLDEEVYIALRLAGFDFVAPVVRRQLLTGTGASVEILGLDGLAMPRQSDRNESGRQAGQININAASGRNSGFSFPPYEVWAAPSRIAQLGWADGERVMLDSGGELPVIRAMQDQGLGHRLVMDIGALQALTDSAGQLNSLLVFAASDKRIERLKAVLPSEWVYKPAAENPDPAALTRSFHLNLAAMGLLAFVVGGFLMYNALAFSYTDRRGLIRKLRLAGLSRRQLTRALNLELCLFLTLGMMLGIGLGSLMATWLLPGIGQTLAQLYNVHIAYPDGLTPGGLWLPVLMTILAGGVCVLFPLRQTLRSPLLARSGNRWLTARMWRRDRSLFAVGIVLLLLSGGIAIVAKNIVIALTGMAFLLLGTALCLPLVLRLLLGMLQAFIPASLPRLSWLIADTRWLLGPASLALMAVVLTLVANSGLNTMIGSFRVATDQWLDRRLAAQIYLREVQGSEQLRAWITAQYPEVRLIERHVIRQPAATPGGEKISLEIVDLADDPGLLRSIDLVQGNSATMRRFLAGEGVLISERAWRLEGWQVGDSVKVCERRATSPVLGVYYDYGNPLPQWMVANSVMQDCWPNMRPRGQALIGPDSLDWPGLAAEMEVEFGWQEGDWINQQEIRAVGLAVFDRTFDVTRALNLLTLLVAGVGIFCAVSAIHHHRMSQQALLASLGVSRRERGALLVLQWGVLGLLSMALVIPFGTVLAAYLASVVTPVAFGWSFPLIHQIDDFVMVFLTGSICLLLAVALPSLRLMNVSPALLLRRSSV